MVEIELRNGWRWAKDMVHRHGLHGCRVVLSSHRMAVQVLRRPMQPSGHWVVLQNRVVLLPVGAVRAIWLWRMAMAIRRRLGGGGQVLVLHALHLCGTIQ